MGEKISDSYRARIDRYVAEYETLSFRNNFNEKFIEIITKIDNDNNTKIDAIDTYGSCNVCRQSYLNRHLHERENCELYENLFSNTMKPITLEETIDIDLWNWKAVEKTSVYFPIWNTQKEWGESLSLIEQLKDPVQIICKPERYWTLFIDKYQQDQLELMKLPKLLSQIAIIDYLPVMDEVKELKKVFDKYDQEEERGIFSKIQNNDQRTTTGHYYLFDYAITTNQYISKNDFYYLIENPPNEIVSNHCQTCHKSFSLFNRRYYCRMCGHQHCSDCLLFKRIPHLGYIKLPVRICRKCSNEKETFVYQHIFTYVKLLIERNYTKYLREYLALLYLYKSDGNESFYRTTGEHFYQLANYSLTLQCFTYAKTSSEVYFKYSIEFCYKKEYSYAFTCMQLCQKSSQFWLEQAVLQNSSIYALLCYECAKLTIEQVFNFAIRKSSDDMDTCLFYLLYLHVKYGDNNKITWKQLAEKTLLETTYDGSVAIFCFYLYGTIPVDQWCQIAEGLAETKQFNKLAYLLSYLYDNLRINLLISSNSYVYFLSKILVSSSTTILLDDWLNDVYKTLTSSINHIVIGLTICHLYRYTSWVEYKTQYVSDKNYIKALLCHKMAEYINRNNDLDWLINAIENFSPVGYELLNGIKSPYDWKQLGDRYVSDKKYDIALNCYLWCPSAKIDEIIVEKVQSSTLPLSIALQYYIIVYKRLRGNNTKQLFHQCLGRLQLSEVQPSEYRSKMYLIQAVIFKLENQLEKSLQSAHDALLCHPYDAVIDGLVIYMDHSNFHSTLRQTLINDIKKRSLDLVDITPPITMMNLTFLNRTEYLRMLKKYERAILKRLAENDPIQAAYSYMDLSMTVTGSGTLLMNNLIMTCLYFFKFMNQTKCTLAELYAYRSIIFDISIEIFLLTRHYLSLYFQMYAYKLLYTLIMCSTNLFTKRLISSGSLKPTIVSQPILNDFHETILDELLKSILQLSKVTPFTHVPSTALSYDMVYMGCAGNEFLSKYLKSLAAENSMYQYYFFEGIWKGWVSAEDFDYERYCCMYLLLRDYQWTTYDVADLLRWPMIPKTHDGWYLSTKHELQLDQSGYAEVIGVTLNNDTGDIEFMFTEAKKTEHKRFDATDVMDVLTNGITYACFTLDPPNAQYHSHPFNEMRYLPKRLVKVPNYLLTLLHTDYLLKMISTGVEICSLTPFEMRSSAENLMQRLPAHIREELQSIAMKHKGPLIDSIHRFWIQLESDIEYEQVFHKNFFGRKNENIVHCYLSDKVKMCVKKHRMKYDEHGNLIDDPSDDENDQSAEAEFARIFTKYYDEIGQYFPELLRLKELLKLSVLSRIIQARYESQCNFIAQIENDTTLRDLLTEIKRKIGRYPTGYEKTDEEILNSLSNSLYKNYFCKKSNLKPYLLDWLKYNHQRELETYLKQSLIQRKAKLKFTIEKLKLHYDGEDDDDDERRLDNDKKQCFWVPAAFSPSLDMKVYGGVLLNPTLVEKNNLKNEIEKSKKSTTTPNANQVSKRSRDIKPKPQSHKTQQSRRRNNSPAPEKQRSKLNSNQFY
ncbi:unnamed protein product [Rotaria sp. Silwood1]|nr:unnamed protein product [Rotaria sp. Silwood1]